jgi:hypothetical protein
MVQYVYLLSDYDEHGSMGVRATLKREGLLAIVDTFYSPEALPYWAKDNEAGMQKYFQNVKKMTAENRAALEKLLEKSDEELWDHGNPTDLLRGWGGMQLHVVRLEE